jgi:Zn-dependent peptidase ImmA (M78 family)
MTNSSSYNRGNVFENKTYELLKTILDNEEFYVSGKKSKIFRKKAYYSEKRKSEIIFDIAIETYLDNSNNYSLLTLIECKNYKSPVAINDLEEFDSKIRQISEHNTKGILISNNSFQSGAYSFAFSNGIGLVRVNENDEFEWLINRKVNSNLSINISDAVAFIENQKESRLNFLALNGGFVLRTLAELLKQMQVIDFFEHKEKFINIPFVTKERIEEIISRLQAYDVYTNTMLDENKICKFLESKYSVIFDFKSDLLEDVLGKIEFDPLKIQITKNLKIDLARWRYTLAHEIGHLILHSKILSEKISEKIDTEFSLSYKYNVSEMTSRRLEYQANLFASNLLLPISSLTSVVTRYFMEERIHKGRLYWDHQPVNQQLSLALLTRISSLYGVSVEVARIRLVTLGLLIDNRYKSLRDILKEMKLI